MEQLRVMQSSEGLDNNMPAHGGQSLTSFERRCHLQLSKILITRQILTT